MILNQFNSKLFNMKNYIAGDKNIYTSENLPEKYFKIIDHETFPRFIKSP